MRYVLNKYRAIRSRKLDKFIFIHINKTGGSSVEAALKLPFEHKTAMQKLNEIGIDKWKNRLVFTIVRNPWDRAVSHYHYRVQTNQTGMGDGHITFTNWIERVYVKHDPVYRDNPLMFKQQYDWLIDHDGVLIVDRILKFEKLTEEFNELAGELGIKARLPHLKKSRRSKSYQEYYTSETVDIIKQCFSDDINNFGYAFDSF